MLLWWRALPPTQLRPAAALANCGPRISGFIYLLVASLLLLVLGVFMQQCYFFEFFFGGATAPHRSFCGAVGTLFGAQLYLYLATLCALLLFFVGTTAANFRNPPSTLLIAALAAAALISHPAVSTPIAALDLRYIAPLHTGFIVTFYILNCFFLVAANCPATYRARTLGLRRLGAYVAPAALASLAYGGIWSLHNDFASLLFWNWDYIELFFLDLLLGAALFLHLRLRLYHHAAILLPALLFLRVFRLSLLESFHHLSAVVGGADGGLCLRTATMLPLRCDFSRHSATVAFCVTCCWGACLNPRRPFHPVRGGKRLRSGLPPYSLPPIYYYLYFCVFLALGSNFNTIRSAAALCFAATAPREVPLYAIFLLPAFLVLLTLAWFSPVPARRSTWHWVIVFYLLVSTRMTWPWLTAGLVLFAANTRGYHYTPRRVALYTLRWRHIALCGFSCAIFVLFLPALLGVGGGTHESATAALFFCRRVDVGCLLGGWWGWDLLATFPQHFNAMFLLLCCWGVPLGGGDAAGKNLHQRANVRPHGEAFQRAVARP